MIARTAAPLPREAFCLEPALAYFNHAAVGVPPLRTRDALLAAIDAHARRGVLGAWPVELGVPEARERVARFIGAEAHEIAFLRNTGDGANTIARGLDWQPGDEIVIPNDEFGANAYPWLALREHGVEVRFVDTAKNRLTPEVLAAAMSARTRLVAVSWVSFADGYRHDLPRLAAVAHERGALFCVDAIQALGAFPVDVRACDIDALYAGGQKWLMAVQGVSFLYLRASLFERVKVRWHGWKAVEDVWDFLNYEQPLAPSATRYEGGTPNFLGIRALATSIEVLSEAGVERIAAHVLALTDHLVAALKDNSAELLTLRGPSSPSGGVSSGIVTFRMPDEDPIELGRRLQAQGFVTTYRQNGIRVSPHGYNTHEEIEAFIASL